MKRLGRTAGFRTHTPRWQVQRTADSQAAPAEHVGEKGFDLESAHFGRVTHIVEVDVALDPAIVGLLRALGMVFEADGITDLIQQLLGAVLFHGLTPPFDRRGCRVHNIVIVGPARQPDCPLALQRL
jgi:hypothetical protein